MNVNDFFKIDVKRMKMQLIHTTISGIVLGKEGPLEESTSSTMEQIGLTISEKISSLEE